ATNGGKMKESNNTPINKGTHKQAGRAGARIFSRHNHHECTSRTTDLKTRTSQSRNEKACDDGRVNTRLRRDPGGDPKSHGKRERHQPHRHTGDQIREKVSPRVVSAQAED